VHISGLTNSFISSEAKYGWGSSKNYTRVVSMQAMVGGQYN